MLGSGDPGGQLDRLGSVGIVAQQVNHGRCRHGRLGGHFPDAAAVEQQPVVGDHLASLQRCGELREAKTTGFPVDVAVEVVGVHDEQVEGLRPVSVLHDLLATIGQVLSNQLEDCRSGDRGRNDHGFNHCGSRLWSRLDHRRSRYEYRFYHRGCFFSDRSRFKIGSWWDFPFLDGGLTPYKGKCQQCYQHRCQNSS